MEVNEVLQQCTITGNIVRLPEIQLERKLYQDVAKRINLIGGKWKGGKIAGFVFEEDPTNYFNEIKNGENRNLKKEFQFFETPEHIGNLLVGYLGEINTTDRICEPSAGSGALVKCIRKITKRAVFVFEPMPVNKMKLQAMDGVVFCGEDFLKYDEQESFDKIIANPPFSNNQDIDHIQQMYSVCDHGGIIVSVASTHWQTSSNKKEVAFVNWLKKVKAKIIEIKAGEFKESGTMIKTCIVIINKD